MILLMTNAAKAAWRPLDTLANRFRLVRADMGLSQKEFGELVGIRPSQVQSIEDGRTARALDVKIRQIAMATGVDKDWLMWGGTLADPNQPQPGGSEAGASTGQ